jgi:hypothetical protein
MMSREITGTKRTQLVHFLGEKRGVVDKSKNGDSLAVAVLLKIGNVNAEDLILA